LLFAFFVLTQIRFLWPTLLLWATAVLLVLFRKTLGRAIAIIGALIVIAFSAWFCVFYIPVQTKRALTRVADRTAPRFSLEPLSDAAAATSATPGKILVLDFFATWCSPCIAELPEVEAVRADLQNNRDIEFLLVGTNSGGDTVERVRAFVQRRHISMPVAFDPDHKTMGALGINGFPSLVIFDRTGRVRLIHQGYNSSETSFRHDLTQLLQSL
jgi:thiol-disulfide isomerase/thioredoxin